MRTKTLLCMAALAAGVASSMAQSNVYSLNVVGYVNYTFTAFNYTLVSNPLDNTTNDLNTVLANVPDGTSLALWSTTLQDFSPIAPVSAGGHWSPDVTVAPGQGFFVVGSSVNFTNTFVGTVRQYPITNSLVGNFNYECIGSTAPLGGSITNVLGQYPAGAGDSLAIWSTNLQDFSPIAPVYGGGHWSPDYPFNVGDGFFIIRSAGPVTWVNQFTVP
jgi:hypothetical protein